MLPFYTEHLESDEQPEACEVWAAAQDIQERLLTIPYLGIDVTLPEAD